MKHFKRGGRGETCQCVRTIPCVERLKELKTVGGRGNGDVDGGALSGRSLVGVVTRVVAPGGKTLTSGGSEHELLAVAVLELVGHGVEVEGARDSHGDDQVRRGDEGVGGGVAVVATSEVTTLSQYSSALQDFK